MSAKTGHSNRALPQIVTVPGSARFRQDGVHSAQFSARLVPGLKATGHCENRYLTRAYIETVPGSARFLGIVRIARRRRRTIRDFAGITKPGTVRTLAEVTR